MVEEVMDLDYSNSNLSVQLPDTPLPRESHKDTGVFAGPTLGGAMGYKSWAQSRLRGSS